VRRRYGYRRGPRSRGFLTVESLEDRRLLATIVVTSTSDRTFAADAFLTLRDAIELTDGQLTVGQLSAAQQALVTGTPGQSGVTDTIDFDIPGTSPFTISPTGALPPLTHPAFIDGQSQPGYSSITNFGAPLIQIQGSGNTFGVNGLMLASGSSGSTIRGLCISGFATGVGIDIESDDNLVLGDYLGTDIAGEEPQPNEGGVSIDDASQNTIGGTVSSLAPANVISGNLDGIDIQGPNASRNWILGNRVGTDVSGSKALGNANGVFILNGAQNNTIGGLESGAANVISGNTVLGIEITGPSTGDNIVAGNLIGTESTGVNQIGNGKGIVILGAGSNMIGGSLAAARNVISGNSGIGVEIEGSGASQNIVAGNYIGTNASGTSALANVEGVMIALGAASNTIGGSLRNVISGNSGIGVEIEGSGTSQNIVAGNYIGTNASGTSALANVEGVMIALGAASNTIGGSFAGAGNVISGNDGDGVEVDANTAQNVVAGNLIGTDETGSLGLGNGSHGVDIRGGVGTTIGGTVAGAGNVIAGNLGFGVQILGTSSNSVVAGNYIGTNCAGSSTLGNLLSGVFITGSSGNTVGGINTYNSNDQIISFSGNVIAGNGFDGVDIVGSFVAGGSSAMHNVVEGNLIGTNSSFASLGNQNAGVRLFQTNQNTIGGAVAGAGNTIAGNGSNGISLLASDENKFYGNVIGLKDLEGPVGNVGDGIQLLGSSNNVIGLDAGDDPASATGKAKKNIISGNGGVGIVIDGGTSNAGSNSVAGNWIGTDLTGTMPLGNGGGGIQIASSPANTVTGNVVGANNGIGISLANADGSQVQDNKLGTDVSGTLNLMLENTDDGIRVLNSGDFSQVVISANVVGYSGGAGIAVVGSSNVQISGNMIGTDQSGEKFGGIGSDGIRVVNSTLGIRGNVISTCNGDGISATNSTLQIQGNEIGTDKAGIYGGTAYNQGDGIRIVGISGSATIGGVVSSDSNVISNNVGDGIAISTAATALIEGNEIGTDITGSQALSNFSDGISVSVGSGVTIGGVIAAASNVISSNFGNGISIATGSFAQIYGNEIGTDITGSKSLGNTGDGISVLRVPFMEDGGCTIGGTAGSAANVISGNTGTGISLDGSAGINISGNFIGVTSTAGTALPNRGDGIDLENSTGNLIGPGNIISGNFGYGVRIEGSGSRLNVLEGNLIGTDQSGQFDVANGLDGVFIEQQASLNTVGGPSAAARNVISGNTSSGVHLSAAGTTSNVITGNYIGTSLSGTRLQGPSTIQPIGVLIDQGATGSIISGNVISGNAFAGVQITGTSAPINSSASQIVGNRIGTDATGTVAVSNEIGVLIDNTVMNTIGGTNPGLGNTISGNTQFGVEIIGTSTTAATANQIMGNMIGPGASGTAFANSGQNVALWYLAENPWLQQVGILVTDSIGNTIGGSSPGAANVISGNDAGVEISGFNTSLQPSTVVTMIMGNSIGITPGVTTIGNVLGVWVNDVPNNLIGGGGSREGNTVSGNSQSGIYIIGPNATGNLMQGNIIGLGPAGQNYNYSTGKSPTDPFPIGIYIQGSKSNTIGGAQAGAGNIISGNNVGVYIFGAGGSATGNQILGNSIGLSVKGGSNPPGNKLYGVMLYNAPSNNAPDSGPGRNKYAGNGIANFREFSGSDPPTTPSSSGTGSGSTATKPAHHSNLVVHQSPRRTAAHATVTVHGRKLPAGPMRKPG